jgi:glycosyltransferase involved in cell wall biosynthesis
MNMKRIKIIHWIQSMQGGGAERALVHHLHSFNKEEFDITLILTKKCGAYLKMLPDSITIISLEHYKWKVSKFINFILLVNRIRPDVVISHLFENNLYLLILNYFLKSGIQTFITAQNNLNRYLKNQFKHPVIRVALLKVFSLLVNRATGIIVVSEGIKMEYISTFKLSPTRIHVVYNPTDLALIEERSRIKINERIHKNQLIAVGRLNPQKGYFDLLSIAKKLKDRGNDFHLKILGEGELQNDLKRTINQMRIDDVVELCGFKENPWAIIKASKVFLSTSHFEGFPLNLIEALSCGTPVISSDCDYGPREVIKNFKNGFLIPLGDNQGFVTKIEFLLNNELHYNEIKKNCSNSVRNFDRLTVIKGYERLIKDSVNR